MNEHTTPARALANTRAEEAVIGKIIGSAEAYWSVADQLSAEHFTLAHHRDIWREVAKCCEDGEGLGMSLLESRLPVEWEGVGSVEAVLLILAEKASDVGSASDFVDELITTWKEREKIAISRIAAQPGLTADATREAIEARYRHHDDSDGISGPVRLEEAAEASLHRSSAAYQDRGTKRLAGVRTGVAEIDKAIGIITSGSVVTLAGASGHAKSALWAQICRNNAAPSLDTTTINPSFFFSLEMSEMQNGTRNLASMTGISVRKQNEGDFTEKEFDALQRAKRSLEDLPILIQDRSGLKTSQIISQMRAAHRRYAPKIYGIDHIKLVAPEKEHWDPMRTIAYFTTAMKAMAKETNSVIFNLAQLTREGQKTGNWRFTDNDVFGGGIVVENSDIVLGVAVPKVWLRKNKPDPATDGNRQAQQGHDPLKAWVDNMERWNDRAEFAALKMRDGSGSEWLPVGFNGPRMTFGESETADIPF